MHRAPSNNPPVNGSGNRIGEYVAALPMQRRSAPNSWVGGSAMPNRRAIKVELVVLDGVLTYIASPTGVGHHVHLQPMLARLK